MVFVCLCLLYVAQFSRIFCIFSFILLRIQFISIVASLWNESSLFVLSLHTCMLHLCLLHSHLLTGHLRLLLITRPPIVLCRLFTQYFWRFCNIIHTIQNTRLAKYLQHSRCICEHCNTSFCSVDRSAQQLEHSNSGACNLLACRVSRVCTGSFVCDMFAVSYWHKDIWYRYVMMFVLAPFTWVIFNY